MNGNRTNYKKQKETQKVAEVFIRLVESLLIVPQHNLEPSRECLVFKWNWFSTLRGWGPCLSLRPPETTVCIWLDLMGESCKLLSVLNSNGANWSNRPATCDHFERFQKHHDKCFRANTKRLLAFWKFIRPCAIADPPLDCTMCTHHFSEISRIACVHLSPVLSWSSFGSCEPHTNTFESEVDKTCYKRL